MKETFSADMVEETGRQIRSNKKTLGELQIQKGVLLERLENIDTMRGEISMLNNGIAVAAGRADCYEALKQAFHRTEFHTRSSGTSFLISQILRIIFLAR